MSKISESARGQDCQVRIPEVCNFRQETTVLAHISGGGMGMKQPDTEAAYCCSACHDVLDGRVQVSGLTGIYLKLLHHEGAMRTRKLLLDAGLIQI